MKTAMEIALETTPKTMGDVLRHLRYTLGICWELARDYRKRFIYTYIATIAMQVLGLILPWLMSVITSEISRGNPQPFRVGLIAPLFGILFIWMLWIAIDILREWMGNRLRSELDRDLPIAALERLLALHQGYHQNNNTPRLAAKVTRGCAYVTDVFSMLQFNILPLVTLLIVTVIMLSVLNLGFSLLTLGILTFYLIFLLRGRLRSRPFYEKREALRTEVESFSGEAVTNVAIVQAFHQEAAMLAHARKLREEMYRCRITESNMNLWNWLTRAVCGDQVQWLMVLLALYLQQTHRISFPLFLFATTLILRYREQLFNFGWMFDEFMEKTDGILKLWQLLRAQVKIVNPTHPQLLPRFKQAELRFNNVSYRYGQSNQRWALREVSLTVHRGEIIGLTGHSGHGKSTILSLISRCDDPTEGAIFLNGIDIATLDLGDLRTSMAIVEQEPRVFNASIRENIAFGRTFTQEEIEEAARRAGAHTFILATPHGYESKIGDRGTKLSGGQKQRLCLARALVGKPSLLILDEATASIDGPSIEEIMHSLELLGGSCTIIIASHQLWTLKKANRIAVIQNGRIVELGSHAELMDKKGRYCNLVNVQQRHGRPA